RLSNAAPLTLNNRSADRRAGTVALDGKTALTITGAFTNSGALDLDTNFGDGGGALTIGGTLANTGNVQVGSSFSNLSAPTTLTLGGLTNASGANFQMFGSASQPVTLAFSSGGSGFSSNAGLFRLSNAAPLTLNN